MCVAAEVMVLCSEVGVMVLPFLADPHARSCLVQGGLCAYVMGVLSGAPVLRQSAPQSGKRVFIFVYCILFVARGKFARVPEKKRTNCSNDSPWPSHSFGTINGKRSSASGVSL